MGQNGKDLTLDDLDGNLADCELESMDSTPDNLEYGVYDGKKPPTPISLENSLSYSLVSVPVEPPKKLETIVE